MKAARFFHPSPPRDLTSTKVQKQARAPTCCRPHWSCAADADSGFPRRRSASRSVTSATLLACARLIRYQSAMGASGWNYFVPYQADIARALAQLRESVFRSGSYYASRRAKRAKDAEAVLSLSGESGTHSILDVQRIHDQPFPTPAWEWFREVSAQTGAPPPQAEFQQRMFEEIKLIGSIAPLSDAVLVRVFGSNRPTHAAVENGSFRLDSAIPRGCGVYAVVYDDAGSPSELFFQGVTGD